MAELKRYDPSLRERIAAIAFRIIGGDEETRSSAGWGHRVAGLADVALAPAA